MHEIDIIWRLGLALALSSAIGLERELRQKAAGLRTYSLVGVGSAVFMLVSSYGFADTLGMSHVTLDPSRVAAQIVSGIGFIGGGIIFVRRDTVRGLTSAAGVWMVAAVGMACGGDLPLVACVGTVIYFIVAYGYPQLVRFLPASRYSPAELHIMYEDGRGLLRQALEVCARQGFSISDLAVRERATGASNGSDGQDPHIVTVDLEVRGQGSISELASKLTAMNGIVDVRTETADAL